MEYNIIRGFIFLIAGLICIIFAKQIFNLKFKYKKHFAKKSKLINKLFYPKYEKKYGVLSLRIIGIIFILTAVILFIISLT